MGLFGILDALGGSFGDTFDPDPEDFAYGYAGHGDLVDGDSFPDKVGGAMGEALGLPAQALGAVADHVINPVLDPVLDNIVSPIMEHGVSPALEAFGDTMSGFGASVRDSMGIDEEEYLREGPNFAIRRQQGLGGDEDKPVGGLSRVSRSPTRPKSQPGGPKRPVFSALNPYDTIGFTGANWHGLG